MVGLVTVDAAVEEGREVRREVRVTWIESSRHFFSHFKHWVGCLSVKGVGMAVTLDMCVSPGALMMIGSNSSQLTVVSLSLLYELQCV